MRTHLGIVGVSSEGAALFYRNLARQASNVRSPTDQPKISIHAEPLAEYLAAIRRDDWHAIGRLLRKSADMLASCGAQCVMTPDNAVQHGVQLAEVGSPIPWLTMPQLVGEAIAKDNRKRVGIIGTKMVCFSSTYQTQLGLQGIRVSPPNEADANTIDEIIFGELIFGYARPESIEKVRTILAGMAASGCEAIILASSELPLIVSEGVSPLPVYDSNELLAHAALTS
jgi:aspartate racemase